MSASAFAAVRATGAAMEQYTVTVSDPTMIDATSAISAGRMVDPFVVDPRPRTA
jgi:hypothetical protein